MKGCLGLVVTSLAICLFFVTPGYGQSEIKVLNKSFVPIAGVNVQNEATGAVLATDDNGQLTLTSTGYFLLSHIGYAETRVLVSANEDHVFLLSEKTQSLNEVQIEGFSQIRSIREQAGSISKISGEAFNRFNTTALVNAVNTLPGIRFEERAAGSYRISIRGSSIRSPFGVRNVKVYWNDIPFTEPGGNTFINLLDLTNVGGLEIIKGPAGSLYGAGTGGVIKIKSTQLGNLANKTVLSGTVGSYGLRKVTAAYNTLSKSRSLTFKYASQKSDGYRDHNEFDRETLEIDLSLFAEKNRTITASMLFSDLFYEIPGGINPDQLAENRKQARPRSESQNSSVSNKLFLLKLGQEYQFSKNFSNKTNIYGSFNQFENPFILDYKRDNQQIYGGRTQFDLDLGELHLTGGFENQNSFFDGKNFGNVEGEADTIRFADEVTSVVRNLFIQGDIDLGNGLFVSAGASRNKLTYTINRTIDSFTGQPEEFRTDFQDVWSPRVGISKTLTDNLSAHLSVSKGFSAPTTSEVRTNEGTVSLGLEPEKGTNYEFNVRGSLMDKKLSFDLSVFNFQLEETIVSVPGPQGVVLFDNAGKTNQNGLELQIQANWFSQNVGFVRAIVTGLAYTYHDFEFRDYINGGDDFSNNALPGTAKSTVNLTTDIAMAGNLALNLTYHYVDPIPLNNANTFTSDAYHLVNARLAIGKVGKRQNVEIFTGIDNVTNAKYSLGNDLNAFGRRYFQPAPERNYYFGVNVKFNHK